MKSPSHITDLVSLPPNGNEIEHKNGKNEQRWTTPLFPMEDSVEDSEQKMKRG